VGWRRRWGGPGDGAAGWSGSGCEGSVVCGVIDAGPERSRTIWADSSETVPQGRGPAMLWTWVRSASRTRKQFIPEGAVPLLCRPESVHWARRLSADPLTASWRQQVPPWISSAHHVATLAGLRTHHERCIRTGENHKAASCRISAAFTWLTKHMLFGSHRAKLSAHLNPCRSGMGHERTGFSCPLECAKLGKGDSIFRDRYIREVLGGSDCGSPMEYYAQLPAVTT
jgi:hypothetical protein